VFPYVFVGFHMLLTPLAWEKGFDVFIVVVNQPLRLSKPQLVVLKFHFMILACLHN
jgi:hypothetical protein